MSPPPHLVTLSSLQNSNPFPVNLKAMAQLPMFGLMRWTVLAPLLCKQYQDCKLHVLVELETYNIDSYNNIINNNLKETVVQMANANGVRWYGHVLRDDRHVLRKVLEFEVKGKRK